MQIIKNFSTAFIILFAVASCKKERTTNPATTLIIEKRIVEAKNITNGDTRKFSYDAQGKVIKVESATHSWGIEYMPAMIKVTRKRLSDGVLLGTDEYSIDASGKMISGVSKSAAGAVTYTYEFEYDAAGYMIRYKEAGASGETFEDFVTNPAGNPVNVKNYYNGALNDVTDYYYDADAKNMGIGTPLLDSYGIKGLAGKVPQREISGLKRFNPSGTLVFQKISSFTTDAQRNIVKYKSTYPLSGQVHDYDITYQ